MVIKENIEHIKEQIINNKSTGIKDMINNVVQIHFLKLYHDFIERSRYMNLPNYKDAKKEDKSLLLKSNIKKINAKNIGSCYMYLIKTYGY